MRRAPSQWDARPGRDSLSGLAAPFVAVALGLIATLAGCARTPHVSPPPVAGDRLEARVNGEPVWTSDVTEEAWALGLGAPGERIRRDDPRFSQALDERIDERLLAAEARRRGLDRAPLERRRLEAARERLLGDLTLNQVVTQAASEPQVRKLYGDLTQGQPDSTKPGLAVLRPRIVRFLSYRAVKDLVLTLRQAARIEAPADDGRRPPGALPVGSHP